MIDSDNREILSGERSFSVINKVKEIRIPCECVGGLILEAIPNKGKCNLTRRVIIKSVKSYGNKNITSTYL